MSGVGTVFRCPLIPSLNLGNASSETTFLNSRGTVAALPLQTDGQFTNKRFAINVAGRVATTSNLTFQVNVYLGTTGTTADTLIFTSSGLTVNAKKSNWHLDLNCFWDSDAQLINGSGFGQIDNQQVGSGGLTNVIKLDPNLHGSSNSFQNMFYKFTVTGLFSGSSAGNSAFLDILEVTLN
jgi:hypothetical protein